MYYARVELKHPLGVRAIAARFIRMLPAFTCRDIGDKIEKTSQRRWDSIEMIIRSFQLLIHFPSATRHIYRDVIYSSIHPSTFVSLAHSHDSLNVSATPTYPL